MTEPLTPKQSNPGQPKPGQQIQVPAKSKHQVKVLVYADKKDLEKETNKFLETISDRRLLKGIVFAINPITGNYVHVINYAEISPMTSKEWAEKQEQQKEFTKVFEPNSLMPNGSKVENL